MTKAQEILEKLAAANPVAKAELERMRTELRQAYADRAKAHGAMFAVCEAADAVLTNEEHAFSGGMRSYKKGSPTWEAYDNLKQATEEAYKTGAVPAKPTSAQEDKSSAHGDEEAGDLGAGFFDSAIVTKPGDDLIATVQGEREKAEK